MGLGESSAGHTEPTIPSGTTGTVTLVRVRRTGGFIGRPVEAEVDLDSDDDRAARARGAGCRVSQPVHTSKPYPDGFTYEFDVEGEFRRVLRSAT